MKQFLQNTALAYAFSTIRFQDVVRQDHYNDTQIGIGSNGGLQSQANNGSWFPYPEFAANWINDSK